jgi:hypothetical protein
MGMMLHMGGNAVEYQDVVDVITPEPQDSHYPIPHTTLVEQATDALIDAGYLIKSVQHALNRDGAHYFGFMELEHERFSQVDYGITVGLRNTHDKTFAAGFIAGSRVFVCDNLAFSGEVKVGRKHTKQILRDLPEEILKGVTRLKTFYVKQEQRVETYKEVEITDKDADSNIIQMFKSKIITSRQIERTVKEWYEPSHEEFAENRNVWRLFNATTEALKTSGLALPKRTEMLQGLLDDMYLEAA